MAKKKPKDMDAAIAKLPVWAQDEIRRLADRATKAAMIADRAMNQFPGTDVRRHEGMNYVDLPPGSRIRFTLGPEHWNWVDVGIGEEAGEKMIDVCGGDLFEVLPRASNSIRIRVQR